MAKILVVDDEEFVLEFVKTALGRIHEVIACDNWLQAIRHIFKERFDLILLDVKLPDITGDSFSSILKKCYSKRLNMEVGYLRLFLRSRFPAGAIRCRLRIHDIDGQTCPASVSCRA